MFRELNEQLEKFLEENKTIEFYTENLEQPIQCEVDLDEYGNGSGKYISGFDLGDTIAVRMLGMRNNDVYGFKIKEINDDNIIAIHPRSGNEYKISFNVKVSSGKELRFEASEENAGWFAFLDLDKSMYNELVTYMNESNLPEFQKMDKLCDLDKHLSESGRYLGMKDSKYGIYRYVRTSQKFNGSWNYDYKLISPEFNEQLEAIEWLANDLLNNNSEEDLYGCIKEGSFVIYNDDLNARLGTTNIKSGKLNTNPKFPTGDNKGIDPVPNYMLEPNKAKANNLRREYIQTHGKAYESLNKELKKFVEKINTEDDLEMDKEDVEEMVDAIMKAIPSFEYIEPDTNGSYKHATCKAERNNYYYNVIEWKAYLYGEYRRIAKIVIKSYGKKVRVNFSLPYPGHGDFIFPRYMKKYAVSDDFNSFIISYFEETKEEIVEDVVENFKRIFDYDRKLMENQENLIPDFRKIQTDICHMLWVKHKDEKEIDLSGKGFNITYSNGTVVPIEKIDNSIYPDEETIERKCRYCHLCYKNSLFYFMKSDYDCRHVRTPETLETFKNLLKFLSGEDDKEALKKAKRQEYNKKRWAEKKAQKLADSKPFDKFLQELKDKYGSGYIAQDVYGYTHVYKTKPYFIPTVEGIDNNDEDVYEPGYWKGETYDNIDYEDKLNKAYKDQYRTSTPSAEKAIWSF